MDLRPRGCPRCPRQCLRFKSSKEPNLLRFCKVCQTRVKTSEWKEKEEIGKFLKFYFLAFWRINIDLSLILKSLVALGRARYHRSLCKLNLLVLKKPSLRFKQIPKRKGKLIWRSQKISPLSKKDILKNKWSAIVSTKKGRLITRKRLWRSPCTGSQGQNLCRWRETRPHWNFA